MRASFVIFGAALGVIGCGGRIDEPSDTPTPASGTNAPASTPSGDGCTRACERMAKTCDALDDVNGSCTRSCRSDFGSDPEAAARYAACLESLSCADIQRGMSMDYGPIGECFTRARRGP